MVHILNTIRKKKERQPVIRPLVDPGSGTWLRGDVLMEKIFTVHRKLGLRSLVKGLHLQAHTRPLY